MTLPLNSSFSAVGFNPFVKGCLYISLLSPVIVDSSMIKLPSNNIPSAGIFSPDSNKTISPTTISSIDNSVTLSKRFIFAFVLEASCCNLSKAFSLPY